MAWAIIREAEKGKNLNIKVLALVDRNIDKDQRWTSDSIPKILKVFSKNAAETIASKFKFGNAKVEEYNAVKEKIAQQQKELNDLYCQCYSELDKKND